MERETPATPGQFWNCNACHALNHVVDGECQFCECGGIECERNNCSAPEHFHAEHLGDCAPEESCPLCMENRRLTYERVVLKRDAPAREDKATGPDADCECSDRGCQHEKYWANPLIEPPADGKAVRCDECGGYVVIFGAVRHTCGRTAPHKRA
jgi:hypothetical protein